VNQHAADSFMAERRRFLKLGAAAAACSLVMPASAFATSVGSVARKLSFVNVHTNERLSATYWQDGAYQPSALNDFDVLLRDWRTDEVHKMDVKLFDLLWELHQRLDSRAPFEIISGYRSPKTNATLAAASDGVAKKSLHMQGRAIDIMLGDTKLTRLRDTAIDMGRGGVGYYAKSGFVHVDTGRVRSW
jgi:uncharacterized protein YcbK (DUF882 family)